jgi:hypothetical protein
MIFNADKTVDEILKVLDIDRAAITPEQGMKLTVILFKQFDQGVSWERDRVIPIVQRMAISPMPIVNAIRKPIR